MATDIWLYNCFCGHSFGYVGLGYPGKCPDCGTTIVNDGTPTTEDAKVLGAISNGVL